MYPLIIKTDHHTPYMYIMPHLTVAVVSFTITLFHLPVILKSNCKLVFPSSSQKQMFQ